jgi:hypothetical protein
LITVAKFDDSCLILWKVKYVENWMTHALFFERLNIGLILHHWSLITVAKLDDSCLDNIAVTYVERYFFAGYVEI